MRWAESPITSLALVCFPEKADLEILERILAGGLSKMIEAGCTVIGGHSIRDEETKFGYAVTGLIDPKKVLANAGAKPGDALLFTKALGTGVISTAIKKGKAEPAWIDAAVQSMTTLNKQAAEVIQQGEFRIHAMTDVTGFGLIGHAREMALASDVSFRFCEATVFRCFRARSNAFAPATFPAASTTTATSPNAWSVTLTEFPKTCERFSSILRLRAAC